MAEQEIRREIRQLSPTEKARYARLAHQVEREFPPDAAAPHRERATVATLGDYYDLRAVAAELRQARESRNLSLADLQDATGIDAERLRRIEQEADIDLAALSHYARAVGKHVRISLSDVPAPADAAKS